MNIGQRQLRASSSRRLNERRFMPMSTRTLSICGKTSRSSSRQVTTIFLPPGTVGYIGEVASRMVLGWRNHPDISSECALVTLGVLSMSIFREMYQFRSFSIAGDYSGLLRNLAYAIENGLVEEIPVTIKRPYPSDERWFRDKDSGEVYLLDEPEPPGRGTWRPVEPEELFPPATIAQGSDTVN